MPFNTEDEFRDALLATGDILEGLYKDEIPDGMTPETFEMLKRRFEEVVFDFMVPASDGTIGAIQDAIIAAHQLGIEEDRASEPPAAPAVPVVPETPFGRMRAATPVPAAAASTAAVPTTAAAAPAPTPATPEPAAEPATTAANRGGRTDRKPYKPRRSR